MTGREGELLFMRLMREYGFTVEDVSNNSNYYYKGDVLITSPTTGNVRVFEVKTDNVINRSGNLYLELTNIYSKKQGGKGWYNFCQADFIAYGDAVARRFYIFSLEELKERVEQVKPRIGYCGNDSSGYKMPLDACRDLIKGVIE